MARASAKPTARRCTSCGKFLASTSTDTLCDTCMARETDEARSNGQTSAFADAETAPLLAPARGAVRPAPDVPAGADTGEAPEPPRPVSSWPPRAPSSEDAPPSQVPSPPATNPGTLLEPGIVIPRPSQLHPSAIDPIQAAKKGPPTPEPIKKSRWGLPLGRSRRKPVTKPQPMQAVPQTTLAETPPPRGTPAPLPRITPTAMPRVSSSPEPHRGIVQPPAPPEKPRGIVQPLAPPEQPRGIVQPLAPPEQPRGIVQPLAPPEQPRGIVQPLSAPPAPAPSQPPVAAGVVGPVPEPMPAPEEMPYSDAPEPSQRRRATVARSRAGFDMSIKFLIAIAIGLGAGLVVPFLLGR